MSNNQKGLSNTKLYRIHRGMINRCYKEYDKFFKDYGGRGIIVCEEWLGANGFLNFYQWAINNGYEEGLSIERKDVNGNYCPENCTFITMAEQQRNKRSNVWIDHDGEKRTIADVSKETGLSWGGINYRLKRGKDVFAGRYERKKMVVRDDGVVYGSIREAGKANGVHESKVSAVCNGIRKRTAGHGFRFLTKEEAEQALAKMKEV